MAPNQSSKKRASSSSVVHRTGSVERRGGRSKRQKEEKPCSSETRDAVLTSLETVVDKEAALLDHILSFVTANEQSDLAMTNRFFRDKVEERREFPCVLRQKRMPTKMVYANSHRFGDASGCVSVCQHQPFEFAVRTTDEDLLRHLSVSLTLINHCWDEWKNRRINRVTVEGGRDNRPGPTGMRVTVSAMDGDRVLCLGDPMNGTFTFNYGGDSPPFRRLLLSCVFAAVMAIADGKVCPTAGHLMHALPSPLHEDFPAAFDMEGDSHDRQTVLEFSYRPAKTTREWKDVVLNPHIPEAFGLDELPWYRNGYWPDDDDSYEYYWKGPWMEASTSSTIFASWRRVRGSQERGTLVIAQRNILPPVIFPMLYDLREEHGMSDFPVPSSQALVIEDTEDLGIELGEA